MGVGASAVRVRVREGCGIGVFEGGQADIVFNFARSFKIDRPADPTLLWPACEGRHRCQGGVGVLMRTKRHNLEHQKSLFYGDFLKKEIHNFLETKFEKYGVPIHVESLV